MTQLSISRAWEDTREIFARDGSLLTAVALALFVLPETLVGLYVAPGGGSVSTVGRIIWIAGFLVSLIGQLAMVRLALGPSTSVGEAIRHGARRFLPTVGAFLLLGCALLVIIIPILIALLAARIIAMPIEGQPPPPSFSVLALGLAVTSLLISVKFTLSVPISSEEAAGPLRILKRSWQLSSGHYWRLLGFLMIMLVTTVILAVVGQSVGGLIARLIGGSIAPLTLGALVMALVQALVSAALTTVLAVMLARMYFQLAGRGGAQASVPSSGI